MVIWLSLKKNAMHHPQARTKLNMGGKYYPAMPETHDEFMCYVGGFFPEIGRKIVWNMYGILPSDFEKLERMVHYPYNKTCCQRTSVMDKDLRLLKTWMFVNRHMYAYWVL